MNYEHQQQLKAGVDVASASTVIGAMTENLPAWAALFTLIWTAIRIYETNTIQNLLYKNRSRRTDDRDNKE